jgi:ArsR family transcriptional regulator
MTCDALTIFNVFGYTLGMDITTVSPSFPTPAAESTEPCCGGPVTSPRLDGRRTSALADRLKALADPSRLRMLDLLVQQAEPLCVCDITAHFEQHQPTISHHLRLLRQAGLIRGEKRGVWSYYAATEEGKRSLSLAETLG